MTPFRLRRPWWARAFAGQVFQLFLAFALACEIGLVIGLGAAGLDVSGALSPAGLAGTAVWTVVWLVGVTGWARVDDDGVSWRFWQPARTVRWEEIEAVVLRWRLTGNNSRATIELRLKSGRQLRVSAANDCGRRRLEFGQAIVDRARRHRITIDLNSGDRRWREIH